MANFLRTHITQGGQAFREIVAHPGSHLLTILVLAVALSLPTTLFLLSKNLLEAKGQWQDSTQITVYLADNVSQKEGTYLANTLSKTKNVLSAEYVSPDRGLTQLRSHSGFEQAISLLEENPLPAVVLVTPVETATANEVSALATTLGLDPQIEEVRLDRDWLQRLQALEQMVLALTVTFSVLMLVGVFLIIGNTLRLTVLSHKEEIQVMKLVGATDRFILRPYLYQGAWLGLSGAFFAWLITLVVALFLERAVSTLAALYDSHFTLTGLCVDEFIILLLLAALTGLLAARLAAAKHLRKMNPV